MTSRERIRAALRFEATDRIPIDIGGTKCTGVHMDLYCELCDRLGIAGRPPKVYDQFMMLAHMDEEMMRWFHSDCVQLENPVEMWGLRNRDWKIWRNPKGNDVLMPGGFSPTVDGQGRIWIHDQSTGAPLAYMPPGGLYFERVCATGMSDKLTFTDPEVFRASLPVYTDEELTQLQKRAKFLYENTPYSIIGGFNRSQFGSFGLYAGHTIGDWMLALMEEPEYAGEILDAHAENAVENARLYLEAVGEYIDVILLSTFDFGTQRCELFDPELFREIYLPRCKRVTDFVHGHSAAKTMYHSCGSNYNLIEYFIQAGIDIFNPIQMNTENMDAHKLKARYGGRMVFWGGGTDTQTTLQYGTTEEVYAQVEERIAAMSQGGGYVFNPSHNLQHGVPMENLLAMMEAVHRHDIR